MKERRSDRAAPNAAQHPERLLTFAALAIAGNGILLAIAWILPAFSEFTLLGDNVSELALGRFGFLQTGAFLVAGVGTIALAFAIHDLTSGSGSLVGCILLGIYGAGAILSAVFPTDRIDVPADVGAQSTTGTVHLVVALTSFVCVTIGMFVLTWTFRHQVHWRSVARWSTLFAGSALALMFVQAEGPLIGLLQRLLVTVIAAWLVLLAIRVRGIASRSRDPAARS